MVKIVKNSVGTRAKGGSKSNGRRSTQTGSSSRRRKPAPKKGIPVIVWVGGVILIIIMTTIMISMNSGKSVGTSRTATSSYEMPRATDQKHIGEMGQWMKDNGTDEIAVERKKAYIKAYSERK